MKLTRRQEQVLTLVGLKGFSIKQAAHELKLKPETVNAHLRRIRAKTGASNTPQAVALAIQKGLLPIKRE